MSDPCSILYAHVAQTIPDSLNARKRVLTALMDILAPNHPACAHVQAQLAALATIEQLQRELPLKFVTS